MRWHGRVSVDDVPRHRPPDRRDRPRSTAPSRRAAPRRTSSATRAKRPSTTTTPLRPRRGAGAPAGRAMAPYPDAVQVPSEEGEQLLQGVTGQGGTVRKRRASGAGPDAALRPAWGRHPRRVTARRGPRRHADAVWLIPAIALTESAGGAAADRQVSSVPTTQESTVKTVDGRPTIGSRHTSRPRMRRGRGNRSGNAGCVARLATDQSRVGSVLGGD